MRVMRVIRLLVICETWVLPLGVFVMLAGVAAVLALALTRAHA